MNYAILSETKILITSPCLFGGFEQEDNMKIVINNCHGCFSLSDKALAEYLRLKGIIVTSYDEDDIKRDDPILVQVVESLGKESNRFGSELKVIDIPDGVDWLIQEYDGREWIAEKHRTWG